MKNSKHDNLTSDEHARNLVIAQHAPIQGNFIISEVTSNPLSWMTSFTLEQVELIEEFGRRYEKEKDPLALIEALRYFEPFMVINEPEKNLVEKYGKNFKFICREIPDPDLVPTVQYPSYPEWLDRAVKDALWHRSCEASASLRAIFNIPAGRGQNSLEYDLQQRKREDYVFALVTGIRNGKKDAKIKYPHGENAYTLAVEMDSQVVYSPLEPGKLTEDTAKKWCEKARHRKSRDCWPDSFEYLVMVVSEEIKISKSFEIPKIHIIF